LNPARTAWEKLIFQYITVPKKAELEGENDRVLENRHMLSSDRPIVNGWMGRSQSSPGTQIDGQNEGFRAAIARFDTVIQYKKK
jgi:hypothetical protein